MFFSKLLWLCIPITIYAMDLKELPEDFPEEQKRHHKLRLEVKILNNLLNYKQIEAQKVLQEYEEIVLTSSRAISSHVQPKTN